MVNYQEGKIYKVVNDVNDITYIGSTVQSLAKRMGGHRDRAKVSQSPFYNAMREIGIERFKIVLIKAYPCNSKAELEAEEYKVMKECDMKLYNDFIGEMSKQHRQKIKDRIITEETKEKISKAHKGKIIPEEAKEHMSEAQKGKFQIEHSRFNYGSIYYSRRDSRYVFDWRENNKPKTISFSCNKYGPHQALLLVYEKRKSVYPEWRTPEEEALNDLLMIEL